MLNLLQLFRSREKFFQLAFHRCIADVLVLQYPVGVDGEGMRNGNYFKDSSDVASKPVSVAALQPSHLLLRNKLPPVFFILVQTN